MLTRAREQPRIPLLPSSTQCLEGCSTSVEQEGQGQRREQEEEQEGLNRQTQRVNLVRRGCLAQREEQLEQQERMREVQEQRTRFVSVERLLLLRPLFPPMTARATTTCHLLNVSYLSPPSPSALRMLTLFFLSLVPLAFLLAVPSSAAPPSSSAPATPAPAASTSNPTSATASLTAVLNSSASTSSPSTPAPALAPTPAAAPASSGGLFSGLWNFGRTSTPPAPAPVPAPAPAPAVVPPPTANEPEAREADSDTEMPHDSSNFLLLLSLFT